MTITIRSIHLYTLPLIALLLLAACGKNSGPIPEPNQPGTNPGGGTGGNATENTTYNHIYKSGEGGYYCFRIPAIVKTKAGTLLAFAEARKNNCGDEGDIDLVVKRSSDKGESWSALSVVWNDADNTCGNPAPVVDQATGKIHLLMTWNLGTDDISTINDGTSKDTRRVYKTSSVDDGKTWAKTEEITGSVKLPGWGWYATGPCHGLQISKGPYAGRLVIPCDYIEKGSGRKGYSHAIYSDDNGTTWKLGGITPTISLNPNESTVAELSDGKLMLNMRVSNNNNLRMRSTSADGGQSWTSPVSALTLVDPVCQGSLVDTRIAGQHTLFFSNAASTTRTNMTIKMSTDDGITWPKVYSVYTGAAAYSDLLIVDDTKVGILYECGVNRFSDGIAYRNVVFNAFR